MGNSRIKPDEPFPDNLNQLEDTQLEVLNSKVHRQLEAEYVEEDGPDPETEHRQEELKEELDDRDLLWESNLRHTADRAANDGGSARDD